MKKNNKFKLFALVAMIFAFAGAGQAQMVSGIYFNALIPTGDFAKDYEGSLPMGRFNIGSDAVMGIGGTYRIGYDFNIYGVIQPFAEASFNWNRISSDNRDKYEEVMGNDAKTPRYFNVPILLGINYRYEFMPDMLEAFGEFGLGMDFFKAGGEKYKILTTDYDLKYKLNTGFSWEIGAGVIVKKYFSAGIHYIGYGNHKMQYTSGTKQADPTITNKGDVSRKTLGSLALRLGFHF